MVKKSMIVVAALILATSIWVGRVFSGEDNAVPKKVKLPTHRELCALVADLRDQNRALQEKVEELSKELEGVRGEVSRESDELREEIRKVQQAAGDAQNDARNAGDLAKQVDQRATSVELRAIDAYSEAQKSGTTASAAQHSVDVLSGRYERHRHRFAVPAEYGGGLSYAVRRGAEIQTPDD